MKREIELLACTRQLVLKMCGKLSLAELNCIPSGFRNSIAWNVIHTLAVQQSLCYVRSGLEPYCGIALIKQYGKGTFPEEPITEEVWQQHLKDYRANIDRLESDYQNKRFQNYQPYTTSLNFTIDTIETAISFNNFHEGIHLGYIMALRRASR